MAEVENPYDAPEKVQARKDQEDPWNMYLIVRKSLGMGAGKVAAQVGHAVGMMYSRQIKMTVAYHMNPSRAQLVTADDGSRQYEFVGEEMRKKLMRFSTWEENSFAKIVLKADDKQWEKLKAEQECFLVRDAGHTEVAPGSETVIGLWPMKKSERTTLLKKLQVLK
jgi:peptidyl-tRNA hydrolase